MSQAEEDDVDGGKERVGWSTRAVSRFLAIREHYLRQEHEELRRPVRAAMYVLLLILRTAQRFDRLRMAQRAAGLAFHTALSLIPVLVLAITVANALGLLDKASGALLDVIFEAWVPVESESMRDTVEGLIETASGSYLGSIGLAFFIYVAITLFNEADQLFNDAWDVRKRRPFIQRLVLFWTILTVAPPLLTGSIVASTWVQVTLRTQVGDFGFLDWIQPIVLPFFLSATAIFMAMRLFPFCRVEWKPALVAALITALVFEITKFGFGIYVSQFASVSWFRIYGAVFLLPVMLLWIYVVWLTLAAGVILGYCLQHFRELTFEDIPQWRRVSRGVAGIAIFEPLVVLASAFREGEGALTTESVAERARLAVSDTERALRLLEKAEAVEQITVEADRHAWHLKLPAEEIRLDHVLDACRFFETADTVDGEPEQDITGYSRISGLESELREVLSNWTLADLLRQNSSRR